MNDIIIIYYNKNKMISSSTYFENSNELKDNQLDYCIICDLLNLNKYLIKHCKLCNQCHEKNKIHCNFCKKCYNSNLNNDKDIIKHKKQCDQFNKYITYK
jgi:hypothetical protein